MASSTAPLTGKFATSSFLENDVMSSISPVQLGNLKHDHNWHSIAVLRFVFGKDKTVN